MYIQQFDRYNSHKLATTITDEFPKSESAPNLFGPCSSGTVSNSRILRPFENLSRLVSSEELLTFRKPVLTRHMLVHADSRRRRDNELAC
jgi:hypothetical protein